jgi:hypothetical protein
MRERRSFVWVRHKIVVEDSVTLHSEELLRFEQQNASALR